MIARLLVGLFVCLEMAPLRAQNPTREHLTIVLFRHAEKEALGEDPGLTDVGLDRAQTLLDMIDQPRPDHLFSTSYRRTRQTISPFADRYGLTVQTYDPRALEAFADTLLSLSGSVLVSGHSNTTPALVGLLTGKSVPPIQESDYGNLYVVTCLRGGERRVDVARDCTLLHLRLPPLAEGGRP